MIGHTSAEMYTGARAGLLRPRLQRARLRKDKDQSSSDLFSCPAGQEDAMQYFRHAQGLARDHYTQRDESELHKALSEWTSRHRLWFW